MFTGNRCGVESFKAKSLKLDSAQASDFRLLASDFIH